MMNMNNEINNLLMELNKKYFDDLEHKIHNLKILFGVAIGLSVISIVLLILVLLKPCNCKCCEYVSKNTNISAANSETKPNAAISDGANINDDDTPFGDLYLPDPEASEQKEPIGDYTVSDEMNKPTEDKTEIPVDNIAFKGYGKYEISKEYPNVELSNPSVNEKYDFVFTLKDKATGNIVAKTDKVSAGKFVYVNVYDYYKNTGEYLMNVIIEAFDKSGNQMNGVTEEMKIIIK